MFIQRRGGAINVKIFPFELFMVFTKGGGSGLNDDEGREGKTPLALLFKV